MKTYWLTFGSTDPRTYTGLSPSFIQFFDKLGATMSPPGISEIFVGSGAYTFNYSSGFSTSVYFLCDGGATLSSDVRYLRGVLDPIDTMDLVAGFTGSDIGSTSIDPANLFAHAKRNQEWLEGLQTFNKSSGEWSILDRGGSTLLGIKTLTNSVSGVTAIP